MPLGAQAFPAATFLLFSLADLTTVLQTLSSAMACHSGASHTSFLSVSRGLGVLGEDPRMAAVSPELTHVDGPLVGVMRKRGPSSSMLWPFCSMHGDRGVERAE